MTLLIYSNGGENLTGYSGSPVFHFHFCYAFTLSCCKTSKTLNCPHHSLSVPSFSLLLSFSKSQASSDFLYTEATICDV